MKPYDFTAIEKKWQAYWEANKTFRAGTDYSKPITDFGIRCGLLLNPSFTKGFLFEIGADILLQHQQCRTSNIQQAFHQVNPIAADIGKIVSDVH